MLDLSPLCPNGKLVKCIFIHIIWMEGSKFSPAFVICRILKILIFKFWKGGKNTVKTTVQIYIYGSFLKISHTNWYFVFRIKAHCELWCDLSFSYRNFVPQMWLKYSLFWVCNIILPTGNKPSVKWKGFEFWPLLTRKRHWVFPFIVKISQWSILGQKGAHGINVLY